MKSDVRMLCTFGTGVRDPEFFKDASPDVIKDWILCLKKFELISVRGNLSCNILNNLGIDNIKIIGDPALIIAKSI